MNKHFNTGNQYAVKEPGSRAEQKISMRVTEARKDRWVEQASAEGLTLTRWIQLHLDTVCDDAQKAKK